MYSRGMGSSIDPFAPDRPNARDRNLYESFDASVGVLLFCASVACVLWTPAWFYFSLVVVEFFAWARWAPWTPTKESSVSVLLNRNIDVVLRWRDLAPWRLARTLRIKTRHRLPGRLALGVADIWGGFVTSAVVNFIPGLCNASHLLRYIGAALSVWRLVWAHVEDEDADDKELDQAEAREREHRITLWGKAHAIRAGQKESDDNAQASSPSLGSPASTSSDKTSPGTPRGARGRRRLGSFY